MRTIAKGRPRLQRDEALIRCAEGFQVPGFTRMGGGQDERGRYHEVLTPDGELERVYPLRRQDMTAMRQADTYNRLHTYRRSGDQVVLYVDLPRRVFAVLAVQAGDDLSCSPFNLLEGPIVLLPLAKDLAPNQARGVILLERSGLERLVAIGALTREEAEVLYLQRRNVGFCIVKEGPHAS